MANKRSKLVLVLFLVSAVVVLALSLFTGFSLNSLLMSLEDSRSERLRAEAQAASVVVAADVLLTINDVEALANETGQRLRDRLSAFTLLHNLTEVTFIRQLPSGEMQYIISSSAGAGIYDISAPPFEPNRLHQAAFSGSIVWTGLHDSEFSEDGLAAFSPVYDSQGGVAAIAAVGVDDHKILQTESSIRNLSIILLVCIAIVILAACANVLLQVRKEQELEESVRVQKLMNEISQSLSSEQDLGIRVSESIANLGSYMEASRVSIINVSKAEADDCLRSCWNGRETNPIYNQKHAQILLKSMRQVYDISQSQKHTAVGCASVSQASDKRYANLLNLGVQAFIWWPLHVQNKLWGVLALEFSRVQSGFSKKDLQLTESVATNLASTLTRELYSEQREQALNHAVRASEVKSEFLSNMSHEMRTPMNAIIGMTSIALGSEDTERKDYCLGHISDASAQLLGIINDVLDMTSIQANELTLMQEPFELRETVGAVISEHAHRIKQHELKHSVSIDESIPTILVGDSQRLARTLSNLLSNAIKFTPPGGFVALRVEHHGCGPEGHRLMFEVEDSGIGIHPSVKKNLFTTFEQADSGTSRKYGGTGLGLVISKHLIEMMGGHIGVESEVNEGSRFFFIIALNDVSDCDDPQTAEESEAMALKIQGDAESLSDEPAEPELLAAYERLTQVEEQPEPELEEQDEAEEPAPGIMADHSGCRVLLAEDIEINREVVLALLEESGVTIDCASNGREAFEAVKSKPFDYDLVFMDLQMPEMDGLEATKKIRALPYAEVSSLPIIAMTANTLQEDIDACLKVGMNEHIGKPVGLEDLNRILEKYLPKKN